MSGIIIIDEVTMGTKANFSSEYLQYAYLLWPHNERDKSSQVRDTNLVCHSFLRFWRRVSEARMAARISFLCSTGSPSLLTSRSTAFV